MQRKQPRYEEGIEYWECPACKRWLPRSSFYSDKRTWNRIKSQCRNCHIRTAIRTRDKDNTNRIRRESMRRTRAKEPEKYRERERIAAKRRPKDIRYYARLYLKSALKGGIISKPERCSKCGLIKKLTAHHKDYMKPLEVEWLCYECHRNK